MNEGIKQIYYLLDSNRVKEALAQLEGISENINDWELCNQIREQQTAYNYMLQYAGQNMVDPNRIKIYQQVYQKVYELTAWMDVSLKISQSSHPFHVQIRTFKKQAPSTYPELKARLESYTEDISTLNLLFSKEQQNTQRLKICQQHEKTLSELFNKTWAHLHWSEIEAKEAWQLIDSLLISSNDKAVLVSAVSLGLMHIWDKHKVRFIIQACQHDDIQVSQRALVGLFFTLNIYEKNWERYPELTSHLSFLFEQPEFRKHLISLQSQLLMTLETDKIVHQMNTEIIPNIMKNSTLKDKNIFMNIDEGVDMNPEWESIIEKTGLNESIRKITEFQQEGGDINMSTFWSLKNFPFFNTISHWFYPFDLNHPELITLSQDMTDSQMDILKIMIHSGTFCDSDNYSFYLSYIQLPQNLRDQNINQLQTLKEIDEEKKEMILNNNLNQSPSIIRRHYIQDLYRFYKIKYQLYTKEELNIENILCIWNNIWCKDLFNNEVKKDIADFLLQKEHYRLAHDLYNEIIKHGGESAEIHQKIGYLLQKQGYFTAASHSYKQADLLMPDHLWTIKHLAQCFKAMAKYSNALELYLRIDSMSPDNLSITQQIGECLIMTKQFEKAIPLYHKILYWNKNSKNAQRALAWCLFHTKKYEEALKYYHQLIDTPDTLMQDWLNIGHVYLVRGEIPTAVIYYNKAKESFKNHDKFIRMYKEDIELLTQHVAKEDILITLDLLV